MEKRKENPIWVWVFLLALVLFGFGATANAGSATGSASKPELLPPRRVAPAPRPPAGSRRRDSGLGAGRLGRSR